MAEPIEHIVHILRTLILSCSRVSRTFNPIDCWVADAGDEHYYGGEEGAEEEDEKHGVFV